MSYDGIITDLHKTFAAVESAPDVPVLVATLAYEPQSIQQAPIVYSLLEACEREYPGGSTVNLHWRTLHRVCIPWQDPEAAEVTLRLLVQALPAAVDAEPHPGGAKDASIARAETGWVNIGGTEYRRLDLYSEVLEIAGLDAG